MKLSIIVPVFNVEKFLEKCILSLVNQDIDCHVYEIIAINDGSTDSSSIILENLKQKISNLIIINQENKGLSGARNTGFNAAQGDYIICVDSDDYLLPNTLKHLLYLVKKNNLDILEFAALGVDENQQIKYKASNSSQEQIYAGTKYLAKITYMSSACNKVYNRKFLNYHKLRFMEGVYIEDIEFNTRAVFMAEKIMATDYVAAHFLQREGSITRTVNFGKKKKMIYDIQTVLLSINSFAECKITPNSVAYLPIKKRVSSLMATMFLRVMKDCKSINTFKEIVINLKKHHLYPAKYPAETKMKQLFLIISNNYWLMYAFTSFFCLFNRIKYGK